MIPRSRSSLGFTLIELLVSVAIIAALAGILLPALAHARDAARQAACQARVRQIHAALVMYADSNRGYIPREGTMGPTPETLRTRIPWNVALRPYLDDAAGACEDADDLFESSEYYRCPAHLARPHRVHYVVNGFAFVGPGVSDERGAGDPAFRRGPMPVSLIGAPERMLYMTDLNDDADGAMFEVWRALGNTDLSIGQCYDVWLSRHITPGSGDFRIGPWRHLGGAVALYLDGHATHERAACFLSAPVWDDGWYAGRR